MFSDIATELPNLSYSFTSPGTIFCFWIQLPSISWKIYAAPAKDPEELSLLAPIINVSPDNAVDVPKLAAARPSFAVILVSGNYVFNIIPNSRLQKAIDKEKFS